MRKRWKRDAPTADGTRRMETNCRVAQRLAALIIELGGGWVGVGQANYSW